MGIKHLWSILTPFCERKPLYELQGKTVAVDLSCWVCEAQNIAEYQVQPRMYLRNLYFRTCYLLLMEVNPVFILEGKAPELKFDTIAARNALQFKGAKPKTDGVKTGKDRSRFNHVLKSCEDMLGFMGLSCIKGKGEAESMCAYLNDEGLVDGCISQDSDCFAYGAKIVYRNFSIASQGAYSASGGAVDVYDISKAHKELNFGRNKIVAMALLCGSDYSDGVHGVGKNFVIKFLEDLTDDETLDKIRDWRKNAEKYDKLDRMINDKNICTACGHHGKIQGHNKNGCSACGTSKGCNAEKFKEERLKIKNELLIRSKALEDPEFPNEVLIQEFLTKKDKVTKLDLKWQQPDLVKFVKFTTKYLQWEELYSFEKILPILTRWQCLNPDGRNSKGLLQPRQIKKVRNPKGVPSYEIIWEDPEGEFHHLIPKEQIEESKTTEEKLWSTIEPQVLVNKAYPKLVEEYQQSKIKPKKPTRRRKKDTNVDEIGNMLKNTSISEPKPKKTRKTSKKNLLKDLESSLNKLKLSKKLTPLDDFLKQAVLNSQKDKINNEIEDIIEIDRQNCHTSTPSKSTPNFMNTSRFGDEEDDDDLSLIIEDIIARKNPNLKDALKKINIEKILDDLEDKENMDENKNVSSFFITNPVEDDFFERTFNDMKNSDENDDTVEYEYDENDIIDGETRKSESDSSGDSFCDKYVPLMDRIKNKK